LAPWISSQALCALLRTSVLSVEQHRGLLDALDAPFAKELTVEDKEGVKYGWRATRSPFPQAEPALWTAAAVAMALGPWR